MPANPDDPFYKFAHPATMPLPPKIPLLPSGAIRSAASRNDAEWMYERIARSIERFEGSLDAEHEIGARLVNFGPDILFRVEDVSFWGPDMIIFLGTAQDGSRVELLQHISQLSLLLIALRKSGEAPRRIGFRLVEQIEAEKKAAKERSGG